MNGMSVGLELDCSVPINFPNPPTSFLSAFCLLLFATIKPSLSLESYGSRFSQRTPRCLREEPEDFQQKVLIYTLGKLYELGRISGGYAAQILGCDLWDFYRLLSENGFAVIDYSEADLALESTALDSDRPDQKT